MIARKINCDPRQLSALLGDTLDEKRQAVVTEHLDNCAHCRQQLENLAADRTWWDVARKTLGELQTQSATASIAMSTIDPRGAADNSQRQPVVAPQGHHWVMALLQPSTDPSALGELDGMVIQAVVGQGGMGVVLQARDQQLQRFLAIKLLSPMLAGSGAARQRFDREARAAAAVVHPNIVPIYAVSAERSLPYLVMPYVAGGNLQHVLDCEGPLSLDRSLSIGLQVAEGLSAAHRQGIVHRDIKPANLMLDEGGFRVQITDFGLARALDDATLTGSGLLTGTPQYMSPEQARGGVVDHRSDIYSLGAVLYALATGRAPIRGDSTFDILRRVGEERPRSIVEINETYPAWYERLVSQLMAPAAAERPQSAEQVAELLRAALAHARSPHRVALPLGLQPQPKSTLRLRLVTTAFACLAVGFVAIATWLGVIFLPAGHSLKEPNQTGREMELSAPTAAVAAPEQASAEPWSSEVLERLLSTSQNELEDLKNELTVPLSGTLD